VGGKGKGRGKGKKGVNLCTSLRKRGKKEKKKGKEKRRKRRSFRSEKKGLKKRGRERGKEGCIFAKCGALYHLIYQVRGGRSRGKGAPPKKRKKEERGGPRLFRTEVGKAWRGGEEKGGAVLPAPYHDKEGEEKSRK